MASEYYGSLDQLSGMLTLTTFYGPLCLNYVLYCNAVMPSSTCGSSSGCVLGPVTVPASSRLTQPLLLHSPHVASPDTLAIL